jgi:hypothetical protein
MFIYSAQLQLRDTNQQIQLHNLVALATPSGAIARTLTPGHPNSSQALASEWDSERPFAGHAGGTTEGRSGNWSCYKVKIC